MIVFKGLSVSPLLFRTLSCNESGKMAEGLAIYNRKKKKEKQSKWRYISCRERDRVCLCGCRACIMCMLAHIYWSIALDFLTPFSTVSQAAYSHPNAPSVLIECQRWGRAVLRFYLTYPGSTSWKYFIFFNSPPASCTLILHHWARRGRKHLSRALHDCSLHAE